MWVKNIQVLKLDLLTEYEMLLMLESGIRGGYSDVLGKSDFKAINNSKHLGDYDSSKLVELFL